MLIGAERHGFRSTPAETCQAARSLFKVPQVVFKDLRFSQLHTKIFRNTSEPDAIMVEDLSSNGTFINGVKIGKGNKRRAVNGDIVSLIVVPRLVEGAWKCPDRNMVVMLSCFPCHGNHTTRASPDFSCLTKVALHPCLRNPQQRILSIAREATALTKAICHPTPPRT